MGLEASECEVTAVKLLTPVVIVFGVTALADLVKNNGVRLSVILGTFVYGTMLFALYEINAELATALAWVVVITALLTSGATVFGALKKGIA